MAALPTRPLRRVISGARDRTARRSMHHGRMVAGRPLDVSLLEFRRWLSHLASEISRWGARTDYLRTDRARRDRGHTRWQIPDHEHGSPTGEHLAAGANCRSPAHFGGLYGVADDAAVG